jgi:hypothetical protein
MSVVTYTSDMPQKTPPPPTQAVVTTVRIPPVLLKRMDEEAEKRGISRTRLMLEATARQLGCTVSGEPRGIFQ